MPSTAVSGLYIAYLERTDTHGSSHIPFVVRDDAGGSDVVVQTSDATWQAYNTYGGNSLYRCDVVCPPGNPDGYRAAYAVSYNRPFNTASVPSWWRSAEYPLIRFLEANGYDVSYTTNVDSHARGNLLGTHKVFVSSGHDEYWSRSQRENVEAARDAGLNLAFFSGNEVFWKTRWADGDRTLVSYKDTHFQAPTDPVAWTGTWRDPRFASPPESTPENALTGTSFLVNAGSAAITVPSTYKNLRLWRGTAVASLADGASAVLSPESLGYEWDEDPDNGFRPPGQFRLSSTTVSGVEVFTDHGTWTDIGTATHHLTMHRRPGGALVFGAGTVQWSWGLDSGNPIGNAPNPTMRQATLNLLADMDAQPYAPAAGLTRATKSTDTAAPTAAIASPSAGATVADGSQVTVSGTATDSGGVVAGVEVSTDDGATWHPATGTTSWSYTWTAHGAPTARLRVRAVDDSGNLGAAGAALPVDGRLPLLAVGRRGDAAAGRLGRPQRGRARRQVPLRRLRRRHRRALLQVGGQHRHARRQPVERRRDAARPGDVHERERVGLAAGDVLLAGPGPAGHDLHRLLPRAQRPLRGDEGLHVAGLLAGPARAERARRAAAARGEELRRDAERRLRLQPGEHAPDRLLGRRQLLGRRRLHAHAGARHGDRRQRGHGRHDLGVGVVGRAVGRSAELVPDHAVRGLGRAGADDRRRQPDDRDRRLADDRHDLPLHRHGGQPRRRGPRVGAVERGHAAGRGRADRPA